MLGVDFYKELKKAAVNNRGLSRRMNIAAWLYVQDFLGKGREFPSLTKFIPPHLCETYAEYLSGEDIEEEDEDEDDDE